MDQRTDGGKVYFCPMHSDVRQSKPGKCPRCGMALLPEGTRFGLLRHMISSPLHLAVMAVVRADGGSHDDATDRSA
jgi:Heavy metal binding domain